MPDRIESNSRKLLKRLRDPLAEKGAGQERLDRITWLMPTAFAFDSLGIPKGFEV